MGPQRAGGRLARLIRLSTSRHHITHSISSWQHARRSSSAAYAREDASEPAGETPQEVAVLGGGITGLTTAFYLALRLPSSSRITLYEGADRLGGWLRTKTVDVDVSGTKGRVAFEQGPRTLRSLKGNLLKADDLVMYDLMSHLDLTMNPVPSELARRRYLWDSTRLVSVPTSPEDIDQLRDSSLGQGLLYSLGHMLAQTLFTRLLGRRPPLDDEISIGDFVRWLGGQPAIVDNLVSAIMHGIYGGDVDRLSLNSLYPVQMWGFYHRRTRKNAVWMPGADRELMAELGRDDGVVQGARGVPTVGMFCPEGGMESIVRNLERWLRGRANVRLKVGSKVTGVEYLRSKDKVKVTTEQFPAGRTFDKVISTIDAKVLSDIASGQLPSLADAPSVNIMAVNLWYPRTNFRRPKGVGYLIPRSAADNNVEGALGVFFDSDVIPPSSSSSSRSASIPESEPDGTKLFVLMGGHHWDSLADADLPTPEDGILMAQNVLFRHLGIRVDTPVHAVAHLARRCIPQHTVGHWARMRATHHDLAAHFRGRLAVAGPSYWGVGVVAAMRAGYDAAAQVASAGGDGAEAQSLVRPDLGSTGLLRFTRPASDGVRMVEVTRDEVREMCGQVKVVRDVDLGGMLRRAFAR